MTLFSMLFLFKGLGLLATIFWLWMIYDCIQNDPERHIWLWILIFLNFPGAILYFIVRRVPKMKIPVPKSLRRWTCRKELWKAEADARNIGNAHQFVILGDILHDIGQTHRAEEAYKKAIEKDNSDVQALWGAALTDISNRNFDSTKHHLQTLLKLEPGYQYGEASLVYGRTLFALGEKKSAKSHLEKHLHNWDHPEVRIILATILIEQNNHQEARSHLESMLEDIRSAPSFYYKANQLWIRKAKRLLKKLL